MHQVKNESDVVDCVREYDRVHVCSGRTKTATSRNANISVAALVGITQYDPAEFTFTALAGTRLDEVEAMLQEKGQYLPFDPPFVKAGATLGGTVASGLSGSGRYKYGGVRDFLLGATFVTGNSQLVSVGSRVVKNAAGFDFPKLFVGSLGCFGVLTELTFKVFPAPKRHATVVLQAASILDAVCILGALSRSQIDATCLDLDQEHQVWVRISGTRLDIEDKLLRIVGSACVVAQRLDDDEEASFWRQRREFAWLPAAFNLVKVAIRPSIILEVCELLPELPKYITQGGHLLWLGWPECREVQLLDTILYECNCSGLIVTGKYSSPFVGPQNGIEFARRLSTALDPLGKFDVELVA